MGKTLKDIIGVYFDFFGTLIDSRFTLTTVWSRVAKKLGTEISPDDKRIWEGILKQNNEYDKLRKEFLRLGKPWIDPPSEEWHSALLGFVNMFHHQKKC